MFWERFWNNLQLKILHGTLCCGLRRDWIVSCYCCPWTHFSRWKVSLAPGFVALGSCLATSKTQHIILSSGKVECAVQQARHAWKSTSLPACFAISMLLPPHLPFHWSHLWRWSQEENLGSGTCRARSFYSLCMTSIILNTALTLWMGPTSCEKTENQKKQPQCSSVKGFEGSLRLAGLVPMWICHCCGLGFCQQQCAWNCWEMELHVMQVTAHHFCRAAFRTHSKTCPSCVNSNLQLLYGRRLELSVPPQKPFHFFCSLQPSYKEMTSFYLFHLSPGVSKNITCGTRFLN